MSITILDGGHLRLDGGAMFGIIPKPLWSRLVEADVQNRIPLAMTCLLLEHNDRRILVETGAGDPSKYDEKERGFFDFSPHSIVDSLAAAGIDRESIDTVILTHLHFDHAGGVSMPDGDGGYMLSFPNARYVIQRGEWEDAVNDYVVMTGSYREENLAPLEKAGVLSLVDNGEAEIVPGLRVRMLSGHTRYQQGVVFESGDRRVVLPADCLPTAAHVGLRFNMGYDLLPFENMQTKRQLLHDAAESGCELLLGQDPDHALWRVSREASDRYALSPVS
ncbi:MAG: MBL fold metallo-hydrolase [Phycisphaerae bacterium]